MENKKTQPSSLIPETPSEKGTRLALDISFLGGAALIGGGLTAERFLPNCGISPEIFISVGAIAVVAGWGIGGVRMLAHERKNPPPKSIVEERVYGAADKLEQAVKTIFPPER